MTKNKVLTALLQETEYCSGEYLSELCGVSRAAIWKQIKKLQEEGYKITSLHGQGYRLERQTDAFLAQEIGLAVKRDFYHADRIIKYETIDSTNAEIKRRVVEGAAEGLVVFAEEQTAGKGRRGRTWVSDQKKGIYCSVLLRPQVGLAEAGQYSFVAAVSVAEGLERATGLPMEIKWPNDVMIGGKKTCGILLELVADMEAVNALILGFGINVNQLPEDFSEELREKATSLRMTAGKSFERGPVLTAILQALADNYRLMATEGFAPIREKWLAKCCILKEEVIISGTGRPDVIGTVSGLREDGALLIQTDHGEEAILSGDVSLRKVGKKYI